jgi:hypothetical protein
MSPQITIALFALAFSLMLPGTVYAQQFAPPDEHPIAGSCVVSLGANAYKKEVCTLSTDNAAVPNGFLMVIEHVSAACSTTPERGIYTLALIAKTSPDGPGRMLHVPVRVQAATREQVRLTGSQMVRAYAGSGTTVEMLVSTLESAPAGFTTCDVNFNGVLKRINQ